MQMRAMDERRELLTPGLPDIYEASPLRHRASWAGSTIREDAAVVRLLGVHWLASPHVAS